MDIVTVADDQANILRMTERDNPRQFSEDVPLLIGGVPFSPSN
jgi:hypothetical protein